MRGTNSDLWIDYPIHAPPSLSSEDKKNKRGWPSIDVAYLIAENEVSLFAR